MPDIGLETFQTDQLRHWQRKGFIYCVRDRSGTGAIKIGFTDAISQKRVMGIFQAVPGELIWIGCFPAVASEERALHKRFVRSVMKGEWFYPTEEVMTFILDRFPDYNELPSKTARTDSLLLGEIERAIGRSRYTLGIFYRVLERCGADVLSFRLWMFQRQTPTRALVDAGRRALEEFTCSRKAAA